MNSLQKSPYSSYSARFLPENRKANRVMFLLPLFLVIFAVVSSCSDSGTGNTPDETFDIAEIKLSTEALYIAVEDQRSPVLNVLNANGQNVQGASVEWSSDDASVADVTPGGTITGKKSGTTTIRVKVKDLTKSIRVDVFQGIGYSSSELEEVDRTVMNYLQQEGIPGASVAVVKDGKLVHVRGYGYADPESQRIAEPNTIFRYGSVSKPITAIAAMKLVEEGKLSLDDKPFEMLSHLPVIQGQNEDSRLKTITLDQLMTHAGGWHTNRNVDTAVWQAVWQQGVRDDAQMLRYGRGVNLATNPGTQYAYTNYATQAVGVLIEHVTGTDYEEWVQTNIMQPLGINNVKLGKTALADRDPNEARYHRANGYRPDIDDGVMDYYGASGSWTGRAVDLVRLLDGVEGKGTSDAILETNTIDTMLERPGFYPASGNYYAKFWQVLPTGDGLAWYHSGLADGAFAYLWRMPNGVSFAILLNQTPPGSWLDLRNSLNAINEWPDVNFYSEFYN